MITISSERGLVRVDAWDDIISQPDFTPEINPNKVKLDAIIGRYRLPDYVVCGLSSCHHKHFSGYLVTTKEGAVTNIGKDCGKTHFGVDFETLSRKFDRDMVNAERRETIIAAKAKLYDWLSEANDLKDKDKGGSWIYKQIKATRDPVNGLPRKVISALDKMIRDHSPIVTKQRLATKQEKEIMMEMRSLKEEDAGGQVYVDDEIGSMEGLSVLYLENDIREILIKDVHSGLTQLQKVDVESASEHELRKWAKWANEVDNKLKKCRDIIKTGVRFFDTENISLLAEICDTREDENQVMAFARRYKPRQ
jgi:hypothetical protein